MLWIIISRLTIIPVILLCFSVLYTVSNCFIRFLPDEDWSLSDIYYKIKQYTKLSNWLPELAGKLRIRFCLS